MAGWNAKQKVQIVAVEFKIHLQFSTGDGSTESHIQILSAVFTNPAEDSRPGFSAFASL